MDKLKIGISIGDINGVGLEVILKTLHHPHICNHCVPVIYGSSKVVSYHKNIVGVDLKYNSTRSADSLHTGKVNVVNCWEDNINITLGRATDISGKYAFTSIRQAVEDLKTGMIDALVTAPINKEAMKMAEFPYPGHTEYLTHELRADESLMFLVNDDLRIGVATNHLPIGDVTAALNKKGIIKKLEIMNHTLRMDFGIERPVIAVLGLNPHAGDGGVIGDEEEKVIRPAIIQCKKSGMIVNGPFPADGFFGSGQYKKYDAILAMYHDQGLIPFKLLSFGAGVNYTAGLAGVRTSPDHGTAYDIAGQNLADPASFRKALYAAIDIARSRKTYIEMHANALDKNKRKTNEFDKEDEVKDIPEEYTNSL